MTSKGKRDISLVVTSFFMKIVGMWRADNSIERRRRIYAMIYTIVTMVIALVVEGRDFYYTLGDFGTSVYIICNIAIIGMGLFKILVSFMHKSELLSVLLYAEKNFWHLNYDPHEQIIVDNCKRTCTILIVVFNSFSQMTMALYVVKPIVENIGKNDSERMLPFNMWIDLPLSMTPYFEMSFVMQVLIVYHVDVCYLCFDNFLCLVNLHTASQFRILQYRLKGLWKMNDFNNNNEIISEKKHDTDKYYKAFRNYVQQHQALIEFSKRVESVFTLIVLGQVLLFSFLICLDGYLILLESTPYAQRLTFTFHITAALIQLLMFTYSCDSLIQASSNVARAVYESSWTRLPMNRSGKMIRQDMTLVMARSQLPCRLTAGGFFTISLETFTTVLSSAASYFAVLNQY